MRRGVFRKTVCYWIAGCLVSAVIALIAFTLGESPIAKHLFIPKVARGTSPDFPDGSLWEWQEERSPFSVYVTSWVRSDDELKAYQLGALPGFEVVERPRWWCYGMERLMPPAEGFVRNHDEPFVVDCAYGWPIVCLSSRLPGPELQREMTEGRRADDGELLGLGSEGLPRAEIGWKDGTLLSGWGWNDGVWPTRLLWPGVLFGGAFWGTLLAVPELLLNLRRAWNGAKQDVAGRRNAVNTASSISIGSWKRFASFVSLGIATAIGFALVASAFEGAWPFRMNWGGDFTFGESALKENGRAWRWTVTNSLARTSVRTEIEDAARIEQWKGMQYEDGRAVEGAAPWWSIPRERPTPPLIHGTFDEMMPFVSDDAFGFPWRCLAHRIEYYDIRFNKGMRGTPPVTAGMSRVSGRPLLVRGVRIELPVLGGVVNSGWWPTRLLWAGLIADSFFFAALWFLAAFVRRQARRWVEAGRLRRGECPGCRYPIGQGRRLATCPECGRESRPQVADSPISF